MQQNLLTAQWLKSNFESLKYFHNNIFSFSFPENEKFVSGEHMDQWCDMLQHKDYTCILAPRKHSKSFSIYSWLMFMNIKKMNEDFDVFYISYNQEMAALHVANYKKCVRNNPFFNQLRDMTQAESIAKWQWPNEKIHTVRPEGILSFMRGAHPHAVVLDDVMLDPTSMMDLSVINKINQRVKEDVMSIPKEGGYLKIIGTAQSSSDFFFALKDDPHFQEGGWGEFQAIQNEKEKKVLWSQKFPYERLMEIKGLIGEKAFEKEYMIRPVWSADSFFTKQEIMECIQEHLKSMMELKTKNEVVMGWDIGKKTHPSHLSVFEFVPIGKGMDIAVQRYQRFLDGVDYYKQLEYVKVIMDKLRVDYCCFDNTRGEMEGFMEKGEMDNIKFVPVVFSIKTKNAMATEFEKRVKFTDKEGKQNPTIQLINDGRMIDQILCVTNNLEAVQTPNGHGDSFWSVALALNRKNMGSFFSLEDKDNVLGLG